MKVFYYIYFLMLLTSSCSMVSQNKQNEPTDMKHNALTDQEKRVIIDKGTEQPFTGKLLNNKTEGTYVCKQCDAPLYTSQSKFDAMCGWPAFDDEIEGAVKRLPDVDGRRTEIICANCGGHLGHVFMGEGFTPKNTRHCVNSISMKFVQSPDVALQKAYFASGCFWGTEYYFQKLEGVNATKVGYMGEHVDSPSYQDVCTGTTGHLEVIEIEYDANKIEYDALVKYFFETHDFTQTDGQGPDIGSQYLSCIFYSTEQEQASAKKWIKVLTEKEYKVATMLQPSSTFWIAEDHHQQYYKGNGQNPYCHKYTKIFFD